MSVNQKLGPKKQLLADLLVDGNVRRRALAALLRGLRAKRSFYDAGSKTTLCEDDYKTQVQSAEILWNFDIGKPTERKEIITHNADSPEAFMARIKNSPELRKMLRSILDTSEKPVVEIGAAQ